MGKFSLEKTRDNVLRAIAPIKPLQKKGGHSHEVAVFKGIPHENYYLIFMLLVDLLKYKYVGPFEKLAYAIPIEYNGLRYFVNYAKFGMRIEYPKGGDPEAVFSALKRGMKAAKPYYLWRAEQASTTSNLNLISKCPPLWEKYLFLKEQSEALFDRYEAEKEIVVVEKGFNDDGSFKWAHYKRPGYEFGKQSRWLHEAAVDSFFAWCEQALVHIAVLVGKLTNGKDIAELLKREFGEKCKLVLDISNSADKAAYDDISALRTELRNYVAHGSFGKDGSTFEFHSAVGAVPLKILDSRSRSEFSFGTYEARDWEQDYSRIEKFVSQLWSNNRSPAKLYIETGFPCILTYATNGFFERAMRSEAEMTDFIEHMERMIDDSANMDF